MACHVAAAAAAAAGTVSAVATVLPSSRRHACFPLAQRRERVGHAQGRTMVTMMAGEPERAGKGLSKRNPKDSDPSLFVKASWYAAELFGQVASLGREKQPEEASTSAPERMYSRQEVVAALRKDYDRNYFVTGDMSLDVYSEDCEFADPFVSFRGRERFQRNVSNLGRFMENIKLDVVDWQETQDQVVSRWRFRCTLGLPWRPTLAASGGTTHIFDQATNQIVRHVERWDISPVDGLRQLFKPGRTPKTSDSK
eukprot:jgi/Chlat1/849/Chrsp104S01195